MKERVNAHMYITPRCNLKCKHCYSADNVGQGQDMEINEMIFNIRDLKNTYDVYFDIEGGELFLHKDIIHWLKSLYEEELNRITLTTNGTIYLSEAIPYLRQLDEFRVSIEGHTDQFHSDIRGIDLKPILSNCEKWIQNEVPVVARITLNKANYKHIDNLFQLLVPMGIRKFSFYEFQSVGNGKINGHQYLLDDKDIIEIIDSLGNTVSKYPELQYAKLSLSDRRKEIVESCNESLNTYNCKVDDLSSIPTITINFDSSVGVCPWHIEEKYHVNEEYGLKEAVQLVLAEQVIRHKCNYCTGIKMTFSSLKESVMIK